MAAQNTFNVGRDGAQLTIFDDQFGQVVFGGTVGFTTKPRTKSLESEGINGITTFRNVPNGHEGDFEFDRQDSSIESYFAQWEANFFAGSFVPPNIIITQTIQELDGGITQFQYLGVTLDLADGGNWKGLDKVTLKVGFKASQKILLVAG